MGAVVKEIKANDVKRMHDAGEIILIDVREPLEYTEEHLAKAQLFPLSHFRPETLPDPSGKKLLFYCHLGRRSAMAAQKWGEHSAEPEVYSLKGGIAAWKEAGLPTVADSIASNKIERQTYVFSGILVLLGLILALFVSEWFLIIPALIAILLIVSGVIGHSFFSFLLSMLPWNR
jgi:rhodanese-related sulfurtransferase